MDLQCSSGKTHFTNTEHGCKRLPGLGVSRKQILTWQQFLNSSLPFCSPGYQGTNWDTAVAHPKSHGNVFHLVHAMLYYGAGDLLPRSIFCFVFHVWSITGVLHSITTEKSNKGGENQLTCQSRKCICQGVQP